MREGSHAAVATFTGHWQNDAAAILDAHYLSRDLRQAESALKKREMQNAETKTPNGPASRRRCSTQNIR